MVKNRKYVIFREDLQQKLCEKILKYRITFFFFFITSKTCLHACLLVFQALEV